MDRQSREVEVALTRVQTNSYLPNGTFLDCKEGPIGWHRIRMKLAKVPCSCQHVWSEPHWAIASLSLSGLAMSECPRLRPFWQPALRFGHVSLMCADLHD
jgi:hypothetical protein